MTSLRGQLGRALPTLACVAAVGLLVALFSLALGQVSAAMIAVGATALALLAVVVSEAALTAVGDAPELALARMLGSMMIRGLAAVAGIAVAITLLGCEPRTVALVALPLYFAALGGEIYEALSSRPTIPSPIAMEK